MGLDGLGFLSEGSALEARQRGGSGSPSRSADPGLLPPSVHPPCPRRRQSPEVWGVFPLQRDQQLESLFQNVFYKNSFLDISFVPSTKASLNSKLVKLGLIYHVIIPVYDFLFSNYYISLTADIYLKKMLATDIYNLILARYTLFKILIL